MIAFEVSVNGKKVCVAGLTNGVFSAMIARADDGLNSAEFNVTGAIDPAGDATYVFWNVPKISLGDEVSIRIVDAEPTPPDNSYCTDHEVNPL